MKTDWSLDFKKFLGGSMVEIFGDLEIVIKLFDEMPTRLLQCLKKIKVFLIGSSVCFLLAAKLVIAIIGNYGY